MSNSTSYVLIIIEELELRRALAELFESEGFEAREETEGDATVAQVLARSPGVVIMSDLIPPLDGLELLPLLRRLTKAPIVVIGDGGETAVVNALLQGADVYMMKPVNFRELMSRVRALLRRSESDNNSCSFLSWPSPSREVARLGPLSSFLSALRTRLWAKLTPWPLLAGSPLLHEDLQVPRPYAAGARLDVPLLWQAAACFFPLVLAMKGRLRPL